MRETGHQKIVKAKLVKKSLPLSERLAQKIIASPTDNMLSPCSMKLKNHKARFYMKKQGPSTLGSGALKLEGKAKKSRFEELLGEMDAEADTEKDERDNSVAGKN